MKILFDAPDEKRKPITGMLNTLVLSFILYAIAGGVFLMVRGCM